MCPLAEVLLLVTCATIASCDDFDDIVAWSEHHLDFLRRFSEFHFGIPFEHRLRSLINHIDPVLFGRCRGLARHYRIHCHRRLRCSPAAANHLSSGDR